MTDDLQAYEEARAAYRAALASLAAAIRRQKAIAPALADVDPTTRAQLLAESATIGAELGTLPGTVGELARRAARAHLEHLAAEVARQQEAAAEIRADLAGIEAAQSERVSQIDRIQGEGMRGAPGTRATRTTKAAPLHAELQELATEARPLYIQAGKHEVQVRALQRRAVITYGEEVALDNPNTWRKPIERYGEQAEKAAREQAMWNRTNTLQPVS